MTDDHQMTRREYREQQDEHSTSNERDSRVEWRSSQEQGNSNIDQSPLLSRQNNNDDEQNIDVAESLSRHESLEQDKETLAIEKTQHLKQKLNKIIIGLLIAIVLVYLILFFVG